ncbi:MAG: transcription termination factor NusA [Oscillospiraceae bacterium]|jgi:N utilization substance protein A
MKKKTEPESNNIDEFFDALAMLEKERDLPEDYLIEKIKNAIIIAAKRDYGNSGNIDVEIDPETKVFRVTQIKNVVDEVEDPTLEITLEDAKKVDPDAMVGGQVVIPLDTRKFGRIPAQTAKHVIRQNIREAEREQAYDDIRAKVGELVQATVMRTDPIKGTVVLEIGRNEALLPRSEQVPGMSLADGQKINVYVVDVTDTERGPKIMLSMTHPGLVKRLFEVEVPEIFDGTVEIKAVAREAGQRTKIAVWSKDKDVDPRGACIGPRGSRVERIVDELGGEKIDVVLWSEKPEEFIAKALSPADVISVEVTDPEAKACTVTVPDDQLSLAIGNRGQNARLAARLTGFKIDIKPENGYYEKEDR